MTYPKTLYFCAPLCPDGPFAGTPDIEGQERLASASGYAPDDVDCLLHYDMERIDLLLTWQGVGIYGRLRRVGCYPNEVFRVYYTAALADDGYYDIRQIKDLKVYGIGVCRSVRGYRRR